jgi:hypothetical protein
MTNGSDPTVTGPIQTIATGPRQRSWVALGTAVVGTVLAVVGFYSGIIAALDGSGSGAGLALVLFFVGLALDLAAIVLAIVTIVRDRSRLLPLVAIGVALIPALVIAWLAISARLS